MSHRIIFILGLFCLNASGQEPGKLELYRWNPGFRAEREAAFSATMTEEEFGELLKGTKPLPSKELYSGCYLAHFERAKASARNVASTLGFHKAETRRVCFKGNLEVSGHSAESDSAESL